LYAVSSSATLYIRCADAVKVVERGAQVRLVQAGVVGDNLLSLCSHGLGTSSPYDATDTVA
jgi:hypothetical protein